MSTDENFNRALRIVLAKHWIGLVTLWGSRAAIIAAAVKYLCSKKDAG